MPTLRLLRLPRRANRPTVAVIKVDAIGVLSVEQFRVRLYVPESQVMNLNQEMKCGKGMIARSSNEGQPQLPSIARSLNQLLAINAKFTTIYADPPWEYDNTSSRAAAANHYQTLNVEELKAMPVSQLCAENAHLHLWTTNAFFTAAAEIIEAWGFTYKSCFVWVKPQLGMGNYWRVSHEFLLFGMRGRLPFADNKQRSWLLSRRRQHSRKPYAVRELIEKVSPGPYLELFGREELPNSAWTVFGDQVERRLF